MPTPSETQKTELEVRRRNAFELAGLRKKIIAGRYNGDEEAYASWARNTFDYERSPELAAGAERQWLRSQYPTHQPAVPSEWEQYG